MRNTAILVVMLALTGTAGASVTEYTSKVLWQSDVPSYTTVGFDELPLFTLITNQYVNLGVLFTDGSDYTHGFSFNTFPNDGYGLNGAFDETTLVFSQPMYTIAIDYPGRARFELYYGGALIYTSSDFGGSGVGFFAGLVSTHPFDRVIMYDPTGGFFIDDLHFGPAIPAPGALGLIALAGAVTRRRKRRT